MVQGFVLVTVALALSSALVGSPSPQRTSSPATVSGKWRMSIVFNDGPRAVGLELKQEGRQVTGRLVASFAGGEVPIEGELVDGKLTFSGATSGGPHPGLQLEFSATLKEDDTLAGTFSSQIGEFPWTAERLNQGKRQVDSAGFRFPPPPLGPPRDGDGAIIGPPFTPGGAHASRGRRIGLCRRFRCV